MTNHINVTIDSSARFRSGSTTSEQKEFNQHPAYWALLAQILKAMVIMASLVGAGVAISWFLGFFESSSPAHPGGESSPGNPHLPQTIPKRPSVGAEGYRRMAEVQSVLNPVLTLSESTSPVIVAMMEIGGMEMFSAFSPVLNKAETLLFVVNLDLGLAIINVSNPRNPTVKSSIKVSINPIGVTLNHAETLAFVASWTGLEIVDIYNVSNPVKKGEYITHNGQCVVLNKAETLAFVANYQTQGFMIVNITNSSCLIKKSELAINNARYIAINKAETSAFVATDTGLVIVDITNTSQPTIKNTLSSTGLSYWLILNQDNTLAFMASDSGLVIVDIHDTINPAIKIIFPPSGSDYFTSVVLGINNSLAFVTSYSTKGLLVIDITDINHPIQKGELTLGRAYGVTLNQKNTLVFGVGHSTGLLIAKLEEIISPSILPETKTTVAITGIRGIALAEKKEIVFLVSASQTPLLILDINNPGTTIGKLSQGLSNYPLGITLNKEITFAFVSSGEIDIIDIRIPSNPILTKKITNPALSIALNNNNNLAYVIENTGFVIYDVSTPSNPIQKGQLVLNPYLADVTVNLENSLGFIADFEGGLVIVNIRNASNPLQESRLATGGLSQGVRVNRESTFAFTASGGAGLVIINVTNNNWPTIASQITTGQAYKILLNYQETLAFVVNLDTGLAIVNISNPSNPVLKGVLGTGKAYAIALSQSGTIAYVGNNDNGLCIVDVYSIYSAIPLIFSESIMTSRPSLKIGQPNNGKLFFFMNSNGAAFNPVITAVSQIDTSGRKNSLPFWLSFSKIDYQFFGIPTKDWSSQELVIRTEISRNGEKRAAQCSIFIEPSLVIDTDSAKLFIQSPGTLASLTIAISNPNSGRFVNQPFPGISFSVDPDSGIGRGVGAIASFNNMFRDLQFSIDNANLYSNTSLTITVDDTINIPQTASDIPLSKFILHHPPVLNPGILQNQSSTVLQPSRFIIPENTFIANPISLSLNYTLSSPYGPLPSWLTYNPVTRQISYTLPENTIGMSFAFTIQANDGYKSAQTSWYLLSQQDPNLATQEELETLKTAVKIIGYTLSAVGAGWTAYKNKALIRNTCVGKNYIKSENPFNTEGIYQLDDELADKIHDVVIQERVSPKSLVKKGWVVLANCVSHHLHGQLTFLQRKHEKWITYDKETSQLRLTTDRLPQHPSEWAIQLLDHNQFILEEIVLKFGQDVSLEVSPSELSMDGRDSLERPLVQAEDTDEVFTPSERAE